MRWCIIVWIFSYAGSVWADTVSVSGRVVGDSADRQDVIVELYGIYPAGNVYDTDATAANGLYNLTATDMSSRVVYVTCAEEQEVQFDPQRIVLDPPNESGVRKGRARDLELSPREDVKNYVTAYANRQSVLIAAGEKEMQEAEDDTRRVFFDLVREDRDIPCLNPLELLRDIDQRTRRFRTTEDLPEVSTFSDPATLERLEGFCAGSGRE